ncbi:MAG: type I secretion protein [Alphaproteobacteria bacterium]|jgi:Ca2+-binding RTX toxin-like protein|nr:type I secretion protein [Alphaproteobacteria bacterium]
MTNVKLTFDELAAGTVVDNEYQADGVTISSIVGGVVNGDHSPAMVFDTNNPTGGDHDLATSNLDNVLIISEDGDSHDPDDEAHGGILRFDFDAPSTMNAITLLDIEECARIKLYDDHGNVIYNCIYQTANNGQKVVDFDGVDGVARMDVIFYGSGALDNVDFDTPASPDGTVEGTAGDDVIDVAYTGDPDGDMVDAGDAILPGAAPDDDLIEAYGGNDTVLAGKGDDEVYGGTGDDNITSGSGSDTVFGEAGDDTIIGGDGNDIADGGEGNDTIDTSGHDQPLPDVGYPGVYPADSDPLNDMDTVFGGAGNDTITTGDDDDEIYGGSGHDTIDAGIDDDYVEGGTGDDTIIGSEGNDEIRGQDGNDTIYGGLVTPGPADALNLPDDLDGDGDSNDIGEDLVTFNNNDTLFGGAGDDAIFGADDDDTLFGGTGDDTLDGGVDDDELYGDDGADTLTGGQGEDSLYGGLGDDLFLGGNGGDNAVGGEDPDLDGDGQSDDWDVLDLTGSNVDYIDYMPGDPEAGTVHFLDGSTMTFSEIEDVIPCFTPGTTIATPKGERLVEELREGDRIITRDNGIQEIRWVGRKDMAGTQLVKNPHFKPILIKAGALGNGLPERDMVVSPNHRVLVASDLTQLYFEEREVLAAAKHLVGSDGVHELDVMQTSYIHFMFDRHEVVLSNGCWTESFQPGDYSLKGIGNSQRNEIFELFPELATKPGLEGYRAARRALKKHEAKLLVK